MFSNIMENGHPQHALGGIQNSSYAAVLQDIFQQAQSEIDASKARNQKLNPVSKFSVPYNNELNFGQSSHNSEFQPLPHDIWNLSSSLSATQNDQFHLSPLDSHVSSTNSNLSPLESQVSSQGNNHFPLPDNQVPSLDYRYEPLWDPALSYINDILAEDEDAPVSHPFASPDEFAAYQLKTLEVAAILKEDSPDLALAVAAGKRSQSPASSEDSGFDSSIISSLESPFSAVNLPDASRNELLLSSLRGSVPKTESILSNIQLPNNFTLPGNLNSKKKSVSQDDIIVRSNKHRPEKVGKVLKPRKESVSANKRTGTKGRANKDDHELVDINDLLLQCAHAALNNTKRAIELLKKVKQYASPYGNGVQRLAYYFAEAMDARFSGTGWPLYLGLLKRRPSSAEILRATYLYMESCPFVKVYHYFINQNILNAAKGATKLQILELQVDGIQYPSLFENLAARPGGPPEVHLAGIVFPHYSMSTSQSEVNDAVNKTGKKLSDYAAKCGVPFKFTGWAGKREELRMQDFFSPYRKPGEVLVILSTSLLRYVMDETLDSPMLRNKLLKQGRDLNPDIYVQGIVTGSYSTPFFARRFREALFHFESVFDMLDTFIDKEKMERLVFESEILGKAIMNVVACEGTEVVDRIDKYKHWQAITEEVGFRQLPLDIEIKNQVQCMLKSWHKEYTFSEDSQYLLMGWKGRMLHAMSTWKADPEESLL